MPRFALVLPIALMALTACETPEQTAVAGALTGAAVGAAVSSKSDRTTGALVGAAVGLGASTLIGRSSQPGQCVYRRANGEQFVAAC